jgi:hypothetical protein
LHPARDDGIVVVEVGHLVLFVDGDGGSVPTLEERVAFLEGRVEEHARSTDGIRDALVHLEERMDRRFEAMDARFETLQAAMLQRFDAMDARFDARFAAMDARFAATDVRFESMDTKFWRLTALMVTVLAAVLARAGGLLAASLR